MDNIRYWVFKHKPGSDADENSSKEFVIKAIRNNYAFMQYEYGLQDAGKVTQNWNRVLEIKEGDVLFLRGADRIYAYGHAIKPRLQGKIMLNARMVTPCGR